MAMWCLRHLLYITCESVGRLIPGGAVVPVVDAALHWFQRPRLRVPVEFVQGKTLETSGMETQVEAQAAGEE